MKMLLTIFSFVFLALWPLRPLSALAEPAPLNPLLSSTDPEVRALIPEVEKRLPVLVFSRLQNQRDKAIQLVLNPKLPSPDRVEDLCSGSGKKVVLGRTHLWLPNRIELNSWLIEALGENPEQETGCAHKTVRQLVIATILHELAHLYDAPDGDGVHRVSDQPGFEKRIWTGGFPVRTPDAYELKNPAESFAVNFELFLLDPQYKCRRPTLYGYLSGIFGVAPFADFACRSETSVLLHSQTIGRNLLRQVDLDPARIYQVHFLFASKGPALMSRWGHAMYRLVVCSPERSVVGPECLRDIKYHVVVSHRAAVADLSISYWKGIWGRYPSQLFLYALPEVIEEYTKLELRDMLSLPLRISDAEKRHFVERVLEQYWGYRGRYYFFANNCADEALKLLQGASDNAALEDLRTLTPLGLYKKYLKAGLIDPEDVPQTSEAESAAEKTGLFFRSKGPAYDAALERLRELDPVSGFQRLADFSSETNAQSRNANYLKLRDSANPPSRATLAGAFYVLETYALMERQRTLSKAVADELDALEKCEDPRAARFKQAFISGLVTEKVSLPASGYGIPLASDYAAEAPAGSTVQTGNVAELQALADEINAWLRTTFAAPIEEIRLVGENIRFFRAEILSTSRQP